MKVGLDISKMHKLSGTRGIGIYAKNLYDSIKKFTDVEIKLIEKKTDYKEFDLIHFPFFDLFRRTLPFNCPKPFVVTIPDLIPLQFPEQYPTGIKAKMNGFIQRKALRNAKAIIAISKTVKNDIISILKRSPSIIFPVYLAPADNYRKIINQEELIAVKEKYQLPAEFLLYVGNVNWNKNILNIAEAGINSGKSLVIVGGAFLDKTNLDHPEKKSHKIFLDKYKDNQLIKLLGFVESEDLPKIMNLATALIFASFYEGFGLPILEAQACGLPVITSYGSAAEEVAGGSCMLVNPNNPSEITMAVNTIFSSPSLRKDLAKKGFENLKKFSWEKTAKETVKVYEKALH